MSGKKLLDTKSGIRLRVSEVGCRTPVPPHTTVYEINTDLRSELGDTVILTTDEATRVALAILCDRFLKLGRHLMDLEDIAELLGLDINDLTKDGDPECRRENGI